MNLSRKSFEASDRVILLTPTPLPPLLKSDLRTGFGYSLWNTKVPSPAADRVSLFHTSRAELVQVKSLEMSEVAILKLSEVQEMLEPLFSNITLHHTRKQGRERVLRKQKTEWRGH